MHGSVPKNPTAAALRALLALMLWIICGVAPLLGYAAYSLGLVGYVTALFKMSSVSALLWAFLFLHENDVPRRLPERWRWPPTRS